MSTKQDGDWGEALVEKYLSERGCRIVEREWRCRIFSLLTRCRGGRSS